jgi:gas vesicle protein
MDSGKVLLGVLAGLAAGAVIGILFAPDKGSVTRQKVYEKGDEYAEELKDKFNDFVENMSQKCEAALRGNKVEAQPVESESQGMNIEG